MVSTVPPETPRESQTLELSASSLASLREWATESGVTAAARVRDPAGRTALIRNGWTDGWFVPGGAVEPDESPAAAAAREVREETGLDARIGDPLAVVDQRFVSRADGTEQFTAEFVLFAATADGEIPEADRLGVGDDEISAARWFESIPDDLHDDAILRPYL